MYIAYICEQQKKSLHQNKTKIYNTNKREAKRNEITNKMNTRTHAHNFKTRMQNKKKKWRRNRKRKSIDRLARTPPHMHFIIIKYIRGVFKMFTLYSNRREIKCYNREYISELRSVLCRFTCMCAYKQTYFIINWYMDLYARALTNATTERPNKKELNV